MTDAPERIFACYDPAFDATYWVGPDNVYLSRHSVGEYIRADKVDALVKALQCLLRFAENTESELGIVLDSANLARAALAAFKGGADDRQTP